MKTRILFFTMIAAALTFSCQKAELENDGAAESGNNNEVVDFVPGPGRILAVSPTGPDTKIAFGTANADGSLPVVWTDGDAIKVYDKNTPAGVVYTYTTESTEGTSSAVFTGDPVEGTTRYAVFPETQAKAMSGGKILVSFLNLNNKQSFQNSLSACSKNLKYMPMWAKESAENEGHFTFTNLCGAVSFKFNDYQELRGMKITNVTITSANNPIAGVGTVDTETGVLTLSGNLDKQKVISIDYPDGLAIGQSSSPSIDKDGISGFIIALPAITYPANDLTVTITDSFGRVFERIVSKELTIAPGQVKAFPTLPFTFAYGEANSVVVEPGATVSFDAALRYSFEKSLSVESMTKAAYTTADAYFENGVSVAVLWEIAESDTSKDVDGAVVTSATLENDQITVQANGAGNALIALKDADGVILWSWHIWVVGDLTDQIYTNFSDKGTPVFMDRNLGATTTVAGNMNTVGLYYQYGRKDPFVISKNFTASTGNINEVELTKTIKRTSTIGTMAWTTKNPDTRINYTTSSSDLEAAWKSGFQNWLLPAADVEKNWGSPTTDKSVDQSNTANDGYKAIYDPCPAGYRVPEFYYFSGLDETNAFLVKVNETDESGIGRNIKYGTADTDLSFYPFSGTLNAGVYNNVSGGVLCYGSRGMYWTSTLLDSSSKTGAAGIIYNSTYINAGSAGNRRMTFGMAANIRCMKIPTASAE